MYSGVCISSFTWRLLLLYSKWLHIATNMTIQEAWFKRRHLSYKSKCVCVWVCACSSTKTGDLLPVTRNAELWNVVEYSTFYTKIYMGLECDSNSCQFGSDQDFVDHANVGDHSKYRLQTQISLLNIFIGLYRAIFHNTHICISLWW